MKKRIISVLLIMLMLIVMLFTLSGCGNDNPKEKSKDDESEQATNNEDKKETAKDLYFKVLNNEIKYINEQNDEVFFSEYMKNLENTSNNAKTKIEYVLFDLDSDSENEMIIRVESYDGFYLILNYEDGKVYGFEDVIRGMLQIKTDGIYVGSGGATATAYMKCEFDKNKRIVKTLAEQDGYNWKVNNQEVDNAQYLEFVVEFNEKEDVEFTTFDENYNYNSNNSNSNNDSKNTFKEGTYIMTKPSLVGTDAEGYNTTITFNNGKVSYLESYWGNKKNGEYTVKDSTLIVKYTSGVEVNSITGEEAVTLNETENYTIEGNEIILQSTTRDKYYKVGDTVFELK